MQLADVAKVADRMASVADGVLTCPNCGRKSLTGSTAARHQSRHRANLRVPPDDDSPVSPLWGEHFSGAMKHLADAMDDLYETADAKGRLRLTWQAKRIERATTVVLDYLEETTVLAETHPRALDRELARLIYG